VNLEQDHGLKFNSASPNAASRLVVEPLGPPGTNWSKFAGPRPQNVVDN